MPYTTTPPGVTNYNALDTPSSSAPAASAPPASTGNAPAASAAPNPSYNPPGNLDPLNRPTPPIITMPSSFVPAFIEVTGAGPTLKSLNAVPGDLNKVLQGTVGGQLKSYQVRAGADAEDLPGIVHPANFDPVNNALVFVQL